MFLKIMLCRKSKDNVFADSEAYKLVEIDQYEYYINADGIPTVSYTKKGSNAVCFVHPGDTGMIYIMNETGRTIESVTVSDEALGRNIKVNDGLSLGELFNLGQKVKHVGNILDNSIGEVVGYGCECDENGVASVLVEIVTSGETIRLYVPIPLLEKVGTENKKKKFNLGQNVY